MIVALAAGALVVGILMGAAAFYTGARIEERNR